MQEIIKENQYFFRFIPVSLQRKSKRSKHHGQVSNNAEIKFALYLDDCIVKQNDQWIQAQFIQNVLKCTNSPLDFCITQHNAQDLHSLSIQVLIKQCIQKPTTDYEQQQMNYNEQLDKVSELGSCLLDPSIYIQTFIDDRKAVFQQNVRISSELSMNYEVYIEQSFLLLQKSVSKYRGASNEGNILVSAFKKIQGHRKVRYVELDDSKQKSVKQEEFKKSHKLLISSLKRSGSKFVPHKIVAKNSGDFQTKPSENTNRKRFGIQNQVNQRPEQENCIKNKHLSLEKRNDKQLQTHKRHHTLTNLNSNAVFLQNQTKLSLKQQKKPQLKVTFVEKYCLQKWFLMLFCIFSLFLLYISMFPSKKV